MILNRIFMFSALGAVIITSSLILDSAPIVEEKQKDKTWIVKIDKIPRNLKEFTDMRDKIASSPQGGIAVYLIAHLILINDEELGEKCLIISLDRDQLTQKGPVSRGYDFDGWVIGSSERYKLNTSSFQRGKSYTAKSYISGTATSDGYSLPPLPYKYEINKHAYQDRDPAIWKGFALTSCNDSGYVPIHVKVNNRGIWKVHNSSSFYSGCKEPPVTEDDSL